MNTKSKLFCITSATLMLLGTFGGNAQAASYSYYLNEKNGGTELPPYLLVTATDSGVGTQVDFLVEVVNELICTPSTTQDCDPYGIQEFGFNIAAGATAPTAGDLTLPTDWTSTFAAGGSTMDGFGKYDVLLQGPGPTPNRQYPSLSFSIAAIAGNDALSYIALNDKDQLFAAQVSGDGPGNAYYSGASPVPVPAAVWLFGTALLGFIGMSRRTKV